MDIRVAKTTQTGSNPINHPCKTGSRCSRAKYRYGNLAIWHKGIPGSKTFINKDVLRSALIKNKDFFREHLGVEIKDIYEGVHENIELEGATAETELVEENPQPSSVDDMTYSEMKDYARENGIDFKGNIAKDKLIELIKNHKEE